MKIISSALFLLLLSVAAAQSTGSKPAAIDDRYRAAVERMRHGDIPAIKTLLADRSVLELRNEAGTPLVMYAALYLNDEGLDLFLSAGADANASNRAGASALHWAATDLAKVRSLLKRGAKAGLPSKAG